ncbi:MAG: SDR family NAD(P)-dependent oxidoreductase, partial [Desulfobulbaceae bacterium]|nr:SDR family NAD(P)-dependent oxidoreductase [Desulfobulbaceae bacterium]
MDYGLANKVALISGSSQGIGSAVAAALAAEGCRVVVTARNVRQLAETAEAIRQAGGMVHAVVGDATRGEDIEQVVAETVSHFGSLHILVNNVGGVGSFAPFHELTDED